MKKFWRYVLVGVAAAAVHGPAVWADVTAVPLSLPTSVAATPVPAPAPAAPAPAPTTPAVEAVAPCAAPCCQADCQGGGRFLVDASLYYLTPSFTNNPAYTVFSSNAGLPRAARAETSTQEFDWAYKPAYAIAAGWVGAGGFGVRGRFFQFDQTSDLLAASQTEPQTAAGRQISVPSFNLPGTPNGVSQFSAPGALLQSTPPLGQDALTFVSGLNVYAVDVEAVGTVEEGPWALLVAAGARYLRIEQVYEAALFNAGAGGASELQRLRSERAFTGAGPTIAVHASRRLGPAGLAVFGSVRGSYVFGRYHEQARFLQDVVDPAGVTVGGSQSTVTQSSASRTTAVPVTELEVGTEYGQPFGRSRAFVRLSAVNQTYFDAGSASQVGGNVNLFGGRVALGLDY